MSRELAGTVSPIKAPLSLRTEMQCRTKVKFLVGVPPRFAHFGMIFYSTIAPAGLVAEVVVVQTLEVEPIRGLEVALDHAASTAFQISGAVLGLTRSLSSLN